MRFKAITAHAFGPLLNETLYLAPGMTVVEGPNEAGKSSWHAALYAGLCGMRRGRGAPLAEDKRFTERHRPWGGTAWAVRGVIELEDDREIELEQDLEGRFDCRATDLGLNRDVSDEIIFEGSPDGSRWLGLTRRSFVATACIRQAEVLRILETPNVLREDLQRAAATAGRDQTAATAIACLEAFRREHVGLDRANSTKPLRRAKDRVERAQAALEKAAEEHAGFMRQAAVADELRGQTAEAERRLRHAEAAQARRGADKLAAELERARLLSEKWHTTPPSLVAEDTAAQEAAAALTLWDQRPAAPALEGPSAEEFRARLEAQGGDTGSRRRKLGAGAAIAVVAVIMASAGLTVPGLLVAAVGLALLVWGALAGRTEVEVLQAHLRAREADEALEAQRVQAANHVLEVARRRRLMVGDAQDAAAKVRDWLQGHGSALEETQAAQSEWAELQALLGGGTLADLEQRADRQQVRADDAATRLDPGNVLHVDPGGEPDGALDCQRQEAHNLEVRAATARGVVNDRAPKLASIPETEEQLAAAKAEIERVQSLDHIIKTTTDFLKRAQDSVHRSIAQVLAEAVKRRLPEITLNRYSDVRLDPETLDVSVRAGDGPWRKATLLSHATAEQIYLLLRVAMAAHLTQEGETCPLILDEVTVQCDTERTNALLDILHVLSADRQVILFSQEAEVLAWAERNLRERQDRLIHRERIRPLSPLTNPVSH